MTSRPTPIPFKRAIAALLFLACLPLSASAEDAPTSDTQWPVTPFVISGNLTEFDVPATGFLNVEVNLHTSAVGGESVWRETHTLTPSRSGYIELRLGEIEPLAPALAEGATYMSLSVQGETLEPRMALGSVPYAARAIDTSRLEGHTLAQIKEELRQELLIELGPRPDLVIPDETAALEARIVELEAKLAAVRWDETEKALHIEGANLIISDGTQSNVSPTPGIIPFGNGLGNLIVGWPDNADISEASHNLILGRGHRKIKGYGNIVSGSGHAVVGADHTVLAGASNTVSGNANVVLDSGTTRVASENNLVWGSFGSNLNIGANQNLLFAGAPRTNIFGTRNILVSSTFQTDSRATEMIAIGTQNLTSAEPSTNTMVIGGNRHKLHARSTGSMLIGGARNQCAEAAQVWVNEFDRISPSVN